MRKLQVPVGDGRVVDVVTNDVDGPAILFHHGTPNAANSYPPFVTAATAAGFRWVSTSRAGYGDSSRRPERSIADNCADAAAVLTHLQVDRFVAAGWSGGGPHALACGALLAPRCAAVLCVGGVAPLLDAEQAGLDWYDGMGPENHEEFQAALAGEPALRRYLEPERDNLVDIGGAQVIAALGGLVDDADKAVLTGEFAEDYAGSFREGLRVSVDGWVDDDLAFVRDWGFDLAEVGVAVSLWQGTDDRMVPFAHGQFLADRLPEVRPHLLAGEGHLSVLLGRFEQMMAEARELLDGR
jgi:pimeloyl-ACP methyl ester carboxylesterase